MLRGPSKIPELLNPPTVFNKTHGVALDGDKPLTECEEESLVEEEARAGGHDESGDTCNLLYQARQAPEAQKFGLFPPHTMKENTSKEPDHNAGANVSIRCRRGAG